VAVPFDNPTNAGRLRGGDLPTHVHTPDGEAMPTFGEELAAEVGRRYGAPVQMTHLRNGIFDEATISVIALDTVGEFSRLAGRSLDVRRFRPNVVVRLLRPGAFQERRVVGRRPLIRRGERRPRHHRHDARRPLLDSERRSRLGKSHAGNAESGGSSKREQRGKLRPVTRTGRLSVRQPILLDAATEKTGRW
jgi:hypothetical protein